MTEQLEVREFDDTAEEGWGFNTRLDAKSETTHLEIVVEGSVARELSLPCRLLSGNGPCPPWRTLNLSPLKLDDGKYVSLTKMPIKAWELLPGEIYQFQLDSHEIDRVTFVYYSS